MAIDILVNLLLSLDWFRIIFKVVAMTLSLGYLIYTVIFYQQLVKMEKNALIYHHLLHDPDNLTQAGKPILFALSMLQLLIAVIMLLISLFLL